MTANKKSPACKGLFITLEGPDGSGKSTQLALLQKKLAGQGVAFILTREPGGGGPDSLAEKIRRLVLEPGRAAISPEAELLLFLAARAQHVRDVITPALAAGKLVLCERFTDATLAYQAGGRGLPQEFIKAANRFASQGIEPDLTLLLDIPSQAGLRRAFSVKGGHDRIEAESLAFHQRVRRAYLQIARARPKRVKRIRADRSQEEVAARIWDLVSLAIERRRQAVSK